MARLSLASASCLRTLRVYRGIYPERFERQRLDPQPIEPLEPALGIERRAEPSRRLTHFPPRPGSP